MCLLKSPREMVGTGWTGRRKRPLSKSLTDEEEQRVEGSQRAEASNGKEVLPETEKQKDLGELRGLCMATGSLVNAGPLVCRQKDPVL